MEWRSVQEERPRSSTSGGQSAGSVIGGANAVALGLVEGAFAPLRLLVIEAQSRTEVQVRHLYAVNICTYQN
jgi:hypothetical protein